MGEARFFSRACPILDGIGFLEFARRMRRCKEWEMAKGMSKKERKLREEIAELEQKKTRGFMQTAGGIIIFVLFLIIRQVLVTNGIFNPETVAASVVTYAIAVVAAGFVGIGAYHYSRAKTKIGDLQSRIK